MELSLRLQVLSAMRNKNQSLAELKSGLSKYPQVLVNVKVTNDSDPSQKPRIQSILQDVESKLGKTGRVLLRRSGTEPLVRVMVEGNDDEARIRYLANQLAEVVKEEMA